MQNCKTKELKILGDYWTLAIIQALSNDPKRFCELEKELVGVNPTTLTGRLSKLVSLKLVNKETEAVSKLSVTYSLTSKGQGVLPILEEIHHFASKYL